MTALLTETIHDLAIRWDEELTQRRGERLQRPLLRHLAMVGNHLAEITLSVWKWVRETLEVEGFEGRELARHCQVLLKGIDQCLTGYYRLLALAEASDLTPEAASLRDLERKLQALREARPKVAELLSLTTRTPLPIEETVLAESRAALERGEFVTLDDEYLGRLQSGEDI